MYYGDHKYYEGRKPQLAPPVLDRSVELCPSCVEYVRALETHYRTITLRLVQEMHRVSSQQHPPAAVRHPGTPSRPRASPAINAETLIARVQQLEKAPRDGAGSRRSSASPCGLSPDSAATVAAPRGGSVGCSDPFRLTYAYAHCRDHTGHYRRRSHNVDTTNWMTGRHAGCEKSPSYTQRRTTRRSQNRVSTSLPSDPAACSSVMPLSSTLAITEDSVRSSNLAATSDETICNSAGLSFECRLALLESRLRRSEQRMDAILAPPS